MKWVKTAIGAVIAIAVIPMIVLAVTKTINQTKIEKVVFTVLDDDGNITEGTFKKIGTIETVGDNQYLSNLKNIYMNGVKMDNVKIEIVSSMEDSKLYLLSFFENGSEREIELGQDKIYISIFDTFDLTDYNFTLEFEVNSLSPTVKTLITLIPLIFISSIIFIIHKKQSFD